MREGNLTIGEVLDVVAKHYGLTWEKLLLMEREPIPYRARHVARYLACSLTRCSLSQIAEATGGVTTTNVVYAMRMIEKNMAKDADFATEVMALKASLLGRGSPDT